MRNVFLIIKNEIRTTLGKRSFWIMTFVFPAIILLLNLGTQLFVQDEIAAAEAEAFVPGGETAAELPQLGYVDRAGVITGLPPDVPTGHFHAYPDEAAAQAALSTGEIDHYLLVSADYPAVDPVLVDPDFSPLSPRQEDLFAYVLTYNVVDDPVLARTLLNPTAQLRGEALDPAPEAEDAERTGSPFAAAVPFVILFVFFFLLVSSSGYMLRSVTREKENRTMEVLLVSLEPRQLMLGKVIGLGCVALLQMAVWLGGGVFVMSGRFDLGILAGGIALPPNFLLWAFLYFLGGYLLYSALMGIVGAMAPNAREGGQFTFVILLPLMIPLWLNASLVQNPNGGLAVALSLIPFTAPVTMMMRMTGTAVPLWQIITGLAGVVVMAYLCVLLAARFFRADTLLSLGPLNWRRFLQEWRTG